MSYLDMIKSLASCVMEFFICNISQMEYDISLAISGMMFLTFVAINIDGWVWVSFDC